MRGLGLDMPRLCWAATTDGRRKGSICSLPDIFLLVSSAAAGSSAVTGLDLPELSWGVAPTAADDGPGAVAGSVLLLCHRACADSVGVSNLLRMDMDRVIGH
jgi:hypothetical protein